MDALIPDMWCAIVDALPADARVPARFLLGETCRAMRALLKGTPPCRLPFGDWLKYVARYGSEALVRMAHAPLKNRLSDACGREGRLDALQWAHALGCPLDRLLCYTAAQDNRLDILAWARDYDCLWDETIVRIAAIKGHLGVIQWAMAHGGDWTDSVYTEAARAGHLDVIAWCYTHVIAGNWTRKMIRKQVAEAAAEYGHLPILQWAREEGYDWVSWVWYHASCGSQLRVMDWLWAQGCPCAFVLLRAMAQYKPAVVQWLDDHGL